MLHLPQQAQPVARGQHATQPAEAEVRPQACFCIDPTGNGATWFCEVGRELWNTQIDCAG